jgi:hypothetical protein
VNRGHATLRIQVISARQSVGTEQIEQRDVALADLGGRQGEQLVKAGWAIWGSSL